MARKISFFTIGIILVLVLVSERISYNNSVQLLKQSMEQRARTVALTTAQLTKEALAMNFLSFLQEEVNQIKNANPDIIFAAIVDSEKNTLAHTDEKKILTEYPLELSQNLYIHWTPDYLEMKAPIAGSKKMEGNIIFALDIGMLKNARSRIVVNSVIKCLVVVFAGILLSYWVANRVVKPLNALSTYAQELPNQDFTLENEGSVLFDQLSLKYKDEVGRLAESFIFMETELKKNIMHLMKTTAAKERIEGELNVARDIQLGLVPKEFPAFPEHNEFDLYATLIPAREVGGDLYDFFFIEEHLLCFALGDVSDKGIPSALFMAMTMTLIKNFFRTERSPARVMTMINEALSLENPRTMFVTIIIGVLDIRTGEIRYSNGGHNPSILIRKDSGVSFKKALSGPVVGAVEDLAYQEFSVTLAPGDSFFMYTDGVNEAMDADNNEFSNEKLLNELENLRRRSARELIPVILEKIKDHAGTMAQSDDIAMLLVKYNGNI